MTPFEPLKDLIAKSVADGNFHLAIEFLTELLKLEDTSDARLRRAELLLRTRCPDVALDDLNRILSQEPMNEAALVHRARAYDAKGLSERAEADCHRVLELNPENPAALLVLGTLLWRRKDTSGAVEAFRRHAALPPEMQGDLVEIQRDHFGLPMSAEEESTDAVSVPRANPIIGRKPMRSYWFPGPADEKEEHDDFEPSDDFSGGFPLRMELDPRALVGMKFRVVLEVEFEKA